ncbi:zinc finger matrin-type protein 5 isoform X1 [Gopherus flavomarginatus]|uniref:zinc finger matrin-type protein 5 isoform X1 n=1 Tax=Gopherus flavomarginatus TaxID=286002 RepID=UPI0021CC1514|nr:zinc finger matrin-type protein 5 isoform X1 [Gopherus flavomarginatus]XP_050779826.1 zinc finger matrin-type protein 5 isoform X1 [Gopherus flavomarginatus]XP_050779827.1 zinc finger matrin-type protein 5 isoform X1 [Gopherus flavomarginatus]
MGKRYFCDYCDRSFQDNLHNRKKHLNGVQHLRAKKAWYDLFRDAAAVLLEEQSKKPCRKFLQTGQCDFGFNCRFSHMTEEDLEKLNAQVQVTGSLLRCVPHAHSTDAPQSLSSALASPYRCGRELESLQIHAVLQRSQRSSGCRSFLTRERPKVQIWISTCSGCVGLLCSEGGKEIKGGGSRAPSWHSRGLAGEERKEGELGSEQQFSDGEDVGFSVPPWLASNTGPSPIPSGSTSWRMASLTQPPVGMKAAGE